MRIVINNFARGMADDRMNAGPAEFGFSKHFDILSNPRRLQPLRGMSSDTANTGIGNMIIASNGLPYGLGIDPNNPTLGKLWQRSGYGVSDGWASLPTNQLSGAAFVNDLLVDWPDAGQIRTMLWASANLLVASDPAGGSGASTQGLSFASIGQGLVHPKDKWLYFPYKTSSGASYIALIAPNGTVWAGLNTTAFALPTQYRAYCLSFLNDFLAIPLTTPNGAGVNSSIVGLWRRDTSITQFDDTIPWGAGSLQVLNNLNGELVGISTLSANYLGSFQDYDSILIKVSSGGEPTLVKEIKVPYIMGSSPSVSHPTATINPRVNFIYKNRLYFSVNLVPGDGVNPARYGLWSVGKNKITGEWTVTQERVATNGNTETGVIAAAMSGDFVAMAHTAEGTLTYTINGVQSSNTYGATSVYESAVNPEMSDDDRVVKKELKAAGATFLPLPSGASVTLKYRVDSSGADADWITAYTYTTAGGTQFEIPKTTSNGEFKKGYSYEFRLESTGGAIITSGIYNYKPLTTIL